MTRPPSENTTTLAEALDSLLHFGAAMLRAGDTAFRVRQWTSVIARAMGLDALSMQVALGSIAATARRGGEGATLVREVASPGINTWRLGALEQLARTTAPGVTARELAGQVAAIEAEPPLYSFVQTAAAVGVVSAAFSHLNGGSPLEVLAAVAGGGSAQWLRSLLFARRLNQYAVTAICAMVASGIYWLVTAAAPAVGLRAPDHAAGYISSVLFLIPGFPLVAALLDLLQHQTIAGITRLAYGTMLLVAAAFGLCIVAAAADLTTTPPPQVPAGELVTLLLRAVASFAGGCGFAILYNSSARTVLAVGILALIGNELRLDLHDAA